MSDSPGGGAWGAKARLTRACGGCRAALSSPAGSLCRLRLSGSSQGHHGHHCVGIILPRHGVATSSMFFLTSCSPCAAIPITFLRDLPQPLTCPSTLPCGLPSPMLSMPYCPQAGPGSLRDPLHLSSPLAASPPLRALSTKCNVTVLEVLLR